MHVIIFAGGSLHEGKALYDAIGRGDMIIAADRGAATALQLGYIPSIVVGDFDSLDTLLLRELSERGSQVRKVAVEKDETDTELAMQMAIEQGATSITLLAALGAARFDHTMANILLLAGFDGVSIKIVDGPSTCWLVRGPCSSAIEGQVGDLVSLLPLTGDASGVRTTGLFFSFHCWTLFFGETPRGGKVLIEGHRRGVLGEGGVVFVPTGAPEPGGIEEKKEKEC